MNTPAEHVKAWQLASLPAGTADRKTYEVINPASQQPCATVPDCTAADARQLADASVEAFDAWKQTTAFHRSQLLRKWFELILAHQDDLAAARACGLQTAYIQRPLEFGAARPKDVSACPANTWHCRDIVDLADQLGC